MLARGSVQLGQPAPDAGGLRAGATRCSTRGWGRHGCPAADQASRSGPHPTPRRRAAPPCAPARRGAAAAGRGRRRRRRSAPLRFAAVPLLPPAVAAGGPAPRTCCQRRQPRLPGRAAADSRRASKRERLTATPAAAPALPRLGHPSRPRRQARPAHCSPSGPRRRCRPRRRCWRRRARSCWATPRSTACQSRAPSCAR